MAKLIYRMGTMSSGKSVSLLKVAHNYKERGKETLIFTSSLDTRGGGGNVSSRIGLSRPAIPIDISTTRSDLIRIVGFRNNIDCILIDEAQFLSKEQVEDFAYIVDVMGIPVIAYGLKADFQNNMFEGSKALLINADNIEETKTICWNCNSKAIMNLRLDENGEAIKDGEQILIGGDESYIPVCRKHWHNPVV